MVQIQSSWFPLYDRNPQTFVPNIFWAKPADYRKATQRIYHAPGQDELRRIAGRRAVRPTAARRWMNTHAAGDDTISFAVF